MNDRRQRRLALLCRLRDMHLEQARADHVAAQAELAQRHESAEDTVRRIAALDVWTVERTAGGSPLMPEVLRQAQLFRGVEVGTLEEQRASEAESRARSDSALDEVRQKFEELSVAERLARRRDQFLANEGLRRGYVDLDEAGVMAKNETKE